MIYPYILLYLNLDSFIWPDFNIYQASELLKHKLLQPYVDQYHTSYSHRKSSAESQSSGSSCSDRDSLVVLDDTTKQGTIIKCDHKDTESKSASMNENKTKQPKIIQNIIMALKEGKSREKNTSLVRVHVDVPSQVTKSNCRTDTSSSIKHVQGVHSLKHQVLDRWFTHILYRVFSC